ncbi:MAG: sulfite exporter TauE/SafE family protein [Armatimonadetes bacterium]|nr:sulfite exporter TauE/SafE family protein [Armatimonadota bacterium]
MAAIIAWAQYLAVGLAVGAFSGLIGIGGGIIMVPLIVLLWKTGPDGIKVAIGTSLAVMIPSALAGSWRHHLNGNVDLSLAACLAIGAVLGTVFIGVPLAEHLPGPVLKRIFGLVMVISGLQWSGAWDLVVKLFGGGKAG